MKETSESVTLELLPAKLKKRCDISHIMFMESGRLASNNAAWEADDMITDSTADTSRYQDPYVEANSIIRSDEKIVLLQELDKRKNYAQTDQEEEKELYGSLAEKKVATEECSGRNGNGRRVLGRRKYQMIDDVKIYESYVETKRKAENRKDWRKLGLQCLRWAGHVTRMGESKNAYRVLVGRPEKKIPLERPRRRWEDNIKMDLREVGYDIRDWIDLAQDRDRWRAYCFCEGTLRSTLSPDPELRLGVDSIPGWADYLVVFVPKVKRMSEAAAATPQELHASTSGKSHIKSSRAGKGAIIISTLYQKQMRESLDKEEQRKDGPRKKLFENNKNHRKTQS
ncbi:hypothetical protein ANN_01008 [Periplaneta americana]|uniref:Uncharacterized protein n=1 Tax=Periplaneta americana TaxID=6978 RepID=A0ABQ8TSF4_PERAM|nr:hypothetical protein ANN_01008 [Periplaneta americana]